MRDLNVPLTVFREGWAWLDGEEKLYAKMLQGFHPVLHLFAGKSGLGDIRIDCEAFANITHRLMINPEEGFKLPFPDKMFEATIFDPPWLNQYFIWAASEVPRVTSKRIIAVTGNFWFSLAPPYYSLWKQTVYVAKGISPLAKLVFVYDFNNETLENSPRGGCEL